MNYFVAGDSTFCNSEGSNMFITNLVDGIDQYKLPEFEKVKVFSHAIKSNYPLQVVTGLSGQLVAIWWRQRVCTTI